MTLETAVVQFVNCTPHAIRILPPSGGEIVVPPSGQIARCSTVRETVGQIVTPDGVAVPVTTVRLGPLEGLPAPAPGTRYVVSLLAGQAAVAAGRDDVFVVDDAVRDEAGRIVACRALARP